VPLWIECLLAGICLSRRRVALKINFYVRVRQSCVSLCIKLWLGINQHCSTLGLDQKKCCLISVCCVHRIQKTITKSHRFFADSYYDINNRARPLSSAAGRSFASITVTSSHEPTWGSTTALRWNPSTLSTPLFGSFPCAPSPGSLLLAWGLFLLTPAPIGHCYSESWRESRGSLPSVDKPFKTPKSAWIFSCIFPSRYIYFKYFNYRSLQIFKILFRESYSQKSNKNLIIRTRSCGTAFITQHTWLLHLPNCRNLPVRMICTTVVPASKGHFGGATHKYFYMTLRHLGSSTAANWVSFDLNVSCSSCWGYS